MSRHWMMWISSAAAAAALLMGCGSVTTVDPSTSTGGAGGGSAAATTSSGSAGAACGVGVVCAPGSHCLFADHACGKGAPGACPTAYCAAPFDCTALGGPPACGCDGVVYDNACLADSAGVGTSRFGACGAAPEGRFACGDLFCAKAVEYCMVKPGDGCGFGNYECRANPKSCGGALACACLDLTAECMDGLQCNANAEGDLSVTCTSF